MGETEPGDEIPLPFQAVLHAVAETTSVLQGLVTGACLAIEKQDPTGTEGLLAEMAQRFAPESGATPSDTALAECLRAWLDITAGRPGAASLAAEVAVRVLQAADADTDPAVVVSVLATAASVAAAAGRSKRARILATEALALAQVALGPTDPATAAAWAAVATACQAAGDGVATRAALKQVRAIRDRRTPANTR